MLSESVNTISILLQKDYTPYIEASGSVSYCTYAHAHRYVHVVYRIIGKMKTHLFVSQHALLIAR